VRANGGNSAVKGYEGFRTVAGTPLYGYTGGNPYFGGVDLNGDGDTLDQVEVYAPSETETHRYGLIANLRWDFAPDQSLRFSYAHDYGRHRQTGEVAYLQRNGLTTQYFPVVDPILDASGEPIQKRNRKSLAILNKIAADYTGRFFDKLTVNVGAGLPFFERDLNNYCVTEANGTFVDCFNDPSSQQAFLNANPSYTPPTSRVLKYHKLLPTAGLSYQLNPLLAVYADYNKGLQVPGTDNLYQSLAFPKSAAPKPETTDNFDAGVRYTSSRVQAQLAAWYTVFNNRLASSYDPIQDITIYRNLGTVHKYGLDGQIAYQPIRPLTLYAFGSILKSKILDDVQSGECSIKDVSGGASAGVGTCTTVGQPIYALTAGKRESGAPTYLLGGRIEYNAGPVLLGAQAKRTGPRYVNDQNVGIFQSYTLNNVPTVYQVYGAKTPAYTVVDLDARINMGSFFAGSPLGRQTYLQLNLTNVFNKLYVAGFTGNTSNTSIPFAYIGAPRTFSASLNIGFGGDAPRAPVSPVVMPPAPPAAAATQTCADGTVILATDSCPLPPAPPAPPVERG
jgi:iron complex outermembrane receptor protein